MARGPSRGSRRWAHRGTAAQSPSSSAVEGELRGRVTEDGSKISGHWIEQGGSSAATRLPTQLELVWQRKEDEVWRGEVVPLDDRITIYLVIEKQPDGTLSAFVRDPERNEGLRLRIERVAVEGETVRMETSQGEISGKYDKRNGILSVMLPFYPLTLDFTKRKRTRPQAFTRAPRIPAITPTVSRLPRQMAGKQALWRQPACMRSL